MFKRTLPGEVVMWGGRHFVPDCATFIGVFQFFFVITLWTLFQELLICLSIKDVDGHNVWIQLMKFLQLLYFYANSLDFKRLTVGGCVCSLSLFWWMSAATSDFLLDCWMILLILVFGNCNCEAATVNTAIQGIFWVITGNYKYLLFVERERILSTFFFNTLLNCKLLNTNKKFAMASGCELLNTVLNWADK